MKKVYFWTIGALFISLNSLAFSANSLYLGLGYFNENTMKKITKEPTGDGSTLGTTSYPLLLKYDLLLGTNSYLGPTLTYTVFPRSSAGESAKITVLQLLIPYGSNFGQSGWDWFVGPGLISRTIKGSGGTVQLNNGSGTATFALPGRSMSSQVLTLNTGASYSYGRSRFALDLFVEGLLSNKRTYDFMLSYAYAIFSDQF